MTVVIVSVIIGVTNTSVVASVRSVAGAVALAPTINVAAIIAGAIFITRFPSSALDDRAQQRE